MDSDDRVGTVLPLVYVCGFYTFYLFSQSLAWSLALYAAWVCVAVLVADNALLDTSAVAAGAALVTAGAVYRVVGASAAATATAARARLTERGDDSELAPTTRWRVSIACVATAVSVGALIGVHQRIAATNYAVGFVRTLVVLVGLGLLYHLHLRNSARALAIWKTGDGGARGGSTRAHRWRARRHQRWGTAAGSRLALLRVLVVGRGAPWPANLNRLTAAWLIGVLAYSAVFVAASERHARASTLIVCTSLALLAACAVPAHGWWRSVIERARPHST